ncbi:MAG: hypothetical protein H0U67_14810 [Gemmatimonadetes bacterium]|nr:hypothetical protein [Gemmatimonadota bacterium]
MDRFRPFAVPGYLILGTMIVFPLLDAFLTVWPLRPGEVSWRFGAVGIFSRGLMSPLFGLILLYGLALIYEHRLVQRVVAVLAAIAAPVVASAAVLFVLDALQMRVQVQPQMKIAFDVASVVALGKLLVVVAIAVVLCIAAFRSSRPVAGRRRVEERGATPTTLVNREPVVRG